MDSRGFGPDEHNARNQQNVLIAESCQNLKDSDALKPYKNYRDAGMKLLGYHVRIHSHASCSQVTSVPAFSPSNDAQHSPAACNSSYNVHTNLDTSASLCWCSALVVSCRR